MDVGLRLYVDAADAVFVPCFNPCFSGCWSATIYHLDQLRLCPGVSILVLVDVGLRHLMRHISLRPDQVSILVLVDVGLRPVSFVPSITLYLSFNPCFSGCWSAT